MNLPLLIEYYEKCKTIKPEKFIYWTYVQKIECGTLCCLWGHAPKFYPQKFEYTKDPEYPLVKFIDADHLDISKDYHSFFEAQDSEDLSETPLLDAIFLGESYEYIDLDITLDEIEQDEMETISLEKVLDRFETAISILKHAYKIP